MKYRSKNNHQFVVVAEQFFEAKPETHVLVNSGLPTPVAQGEEPMGKFWCGHVDKPREVRDGDWIVDTRVLDEEGNMKGDVYAVTPTRFEATYELVP